MSSTAAPVTYASRVYDAVKVYGSGSTEIHALAGVTVGFEAARFTAIMGPSGSGKSTLMQCAAGLDYLTSGRVFLGDTELSLLDPTDLTLVRREQMGFVFQSYNLVAALTAEENIRLPAKMAKRPLDEEYLARVVAAVGLGDRLGHRPSELSGGQQQRVAIARALVGRPAVVFADEPTGNLDSTSGAEVLGFLRRSVDADGQTVVMVTHDPRAAAHADRVLFLADGRLVDEVLSPTAGQLLDRMAVLTGA